ncbi:MAG: hypothetical protein E7018_01870 [Alphaproteobacteria bacterium]|nr:hypothetical protein [Alphaproteobacteria bacterium]
MEVKDLNNVSSVQAMFSKAVAGAKTGQVLGDGFASLVSQVSDIVGGASKSEPVERSDSKIVVDNKAKPSAEKVDTKKEKNVKKSKPSSDDKEAAVSKKERKSSASDVSTDASAVAEDNSNTKTVSEGADTPVVSENAVQSNASVEEKNSAEGELSSVLPVAKNVIADVAALPQAMDIKLPVVEGGEQAPLAVVNSESMVLTSQNLDLSAIASMPVVNVVNADTGEVVAMSGAEFVEKVQQFATQENLFVPTEMIDNQINQVVAAEIIAEESKGSSFVADTVDVLPQSEVFASEELLEQAKVLDVKVGKENKVSIDVNVVEEEISHMNGNRLVQDTVALEEVVEASFVSKAEGEISSVSENLSNIKTQNSSVQNAQMQNIVSISQPVAVEAQVSAEAAKSVAVEGVSSLTGTSGQAAGASVALHAEAQVSNKTQEASFRDVFKGMSKEVVEQVKVNITKSAVKGVDNIDIKLRPQELGSIEIKMQISKEGKLQAHIIASRPETVEILQKEIQSLEKAFNDAGFETDAGSLSFSFREGGESNREQERSSELRNFIGNALEHDASEEMADNDNMHGWVSAQGVNIRV